MGKLIIIKTVEAVVISKEVRKILFASNNANISIAGIIEKTYFAAIMLTSYSYPRKRSIYSMKYMNTVSGTNIKMSSVRVLFRNSPHYFKSPFPIAIEQSVSRVEVIPSMIG